MASPGRLLSSPPKGANLQEELAFWKAQYENLEVELQEFQSSSKELEAELEKDIEASEQKERTLREKAEALQFEVDEWKTKYKQSKEESNKAQNSLQKEITTLRESNRSMQYKLRDVEVQNDDFERQARNQTSSLEDLESKYNVSIERGVLLEEEMRSNEQERENLRIESQHLKDELTDLKVEVEILQNKLHHAEQIIERDRSRTINPLSTDNLRPPSPMSEASTSATSTTSPSLATPPPATSEISTVETSPPSPPLSDASGAIPTKKRVPGPITPLMNKTRMLPTTTPRVTGSRVPRHSRGPSFSTAAMTPLAHKTQPKVQPKAQPKTPRVPTSRLSYSTQLPPPSTSSRSLHQIRGLIGKMQKLEERVHTARSKLPAPTSTPPRASPRSDESTNLHSIPSSVTVRSARKRVSQSTIASNYTVNSAEPPRTASRLSFGFTAKQATEDPSRPSSRASQHATTQFVRPSSRASVTGRSTPYGNGNDTTPSRPRSSISGHYAATQSAREPLGPPARANTPGPKVRSHGFSRSVSMAIGAGAEEEAWTAAPGRTTPITARRTTLERGQLGSGIPAPGLSRRQSGGLQAGGALAPGVSARRQSGASSIVIGAASSAETGSASSTFGEMRPPNQKGRRLSGVGETF